MLAATFITQIKSSLLLYGLCLCNNDDSQAVLNVTDSSDNNSLRTNGPNSAAKLQKKYCVKKERERERKSVLRSD